MRELPRTLLADLRCPCCRAALRPVVELNVSSDGLTDAIVRCDCYDYPVVRGIAVLRQMSPVFSTQNGAVERLRAGDAEGALSWLLDNGSAPGVSRPSARKTAVAAAPVSLTSKLRSLLQGNPAPESPAAERQEEDFEAALRSHRPSGYADYLFQRFANPSFLGAIPSLGVLGAACSEGPRRRVLDVLCGAGHSSATIMALAPDVQVIMADVDFVNLFLGRSFLAPGAFAICIDAELPLPLVDDSVDGVFCLDGLHYVRSKVALLDEVNRVVSAHGHWLFAHMHNANAENTNPGTPLTPSGYAERFSFGEARLLPESSLLQQFGETGALDLTQQPADDLLSSSNALTLFGGRDADLWRRHAGLDGLVSARPGLLGLNPLYKPERVSDGVIVRAQWPSAALEQECTASGALLPESVHLSQRALDAIETARAGGPLSDEVRKLIRAFVLVPLPACYPQHLPSAVRRGTLSIPGLFAMGLQAADFLMTNELSCGLGLLVSRAPL